MYTELGQQYKETILPLGHERLRRLSDEGVGFSGFAHIDDSYIIMRNEGYYQHLILYTLNGEGWIQCDGVDVKVKPGDVWICSEGTAHEYGLIGSNWSILWASLDTVSRWRPIYDIRHQIRPSHLGSVIHGLYMSLIHASEEQNFNSDEECRHLCELLVIYLEREVAARQSDRRDRAVQLTFRELFKKVSQDPGRNWNIQALQDECDHSYGTDHFIRLCRKAYGKTPMKVVQEIRMQRAWVLVSNTKLSIQQISAMTGYSNPYAFSTAFTRRWGHCPRDVRALS